MAKLDAFVGPGGGVNPLESRLPTDELSTSLLFSGALDAHRLGLVGDGGKPRFMMPFDPAVADADALAALALVAPAVDEPPSRRRSADA